jgi:hypothetical protein
LPCSEPGCTKTFSDPSCLCKHRQGVHGAPGRRRRTDESGSLRRGSGPSTAAPQKTSQGADELPLLWCSYTPTSTSFEFRGVFNDPHDVQTDRSSIDEKNKFEHQEASNANYPDAQTAWGSQDAQREATFTLLPRPYTRSPSDAGKEVSEASQPTQRCRYYDLKSPALRGQQWERRQAESDGFSSPTNGHVHSSYNRPSEYLRPNITGILF